MSRENIKDFYGRIIGSLETLPNGDKIARDFYGKILGRYDATTNTTKDFYGRILTSGDTSASLIWQNNSNK